MKVGFLGLGVMGLPMAANLLKAGFEVVCFNRTREKEEPLLALGAQRAQDMRDMAARCDVVVLCLTDERSVEQVVFGADGLLSGESRIRYIIDCSTINVDSAVAFAKQLAARGIHFFDSPVSGGEQGARDGTLTIMAGGDEAAFTEVRPVYDAMGQNILYFGESGAGQKVKLINQLLTWVNLAVICEASVLAKKAGLDEDKLYDCLMTSYGASKALELSYKPHIQPENFETATGMYMMVKDLNLLRQFAQSFGAKLPMTDTAMELYQKAMDDGHGNKHQSIIMKLLQD